MGHYKSNLRDIEFTLFEVLGRGDVLAAVHREGEVVSTTESSDGIRVRARLADASAGRLSEFVIPAAGSAAGSS